MANIQAHLNLRFLSSNFLMIEYTTFILMGFVNRYIILLIKLLLNIMDHLLFMNLLVRIKASFNQIDSNYYTF